MTEWWNEHENSPVPGNAGIHILLSFSTSSGPPRWAVEIAQAIGAPPSSVYRFLLSLKGAGLVEQEPQSGRYTLGLSCWSWARSCTGGWTWNGSPRR